MVFDTPWVYYNRSGRLGMAGVGWRYVMEGWTSDGVLKVGILLLVIRVTGVSGWQGR
jgi:hypothetical protein